MHDFVNSGELDARDVGELKALVAYSDLFLNGTVDSKTFKIFNELVSNTSKVSEQLLGGNCNAKELKLVQENFPEHMKITGYFSGFAVGMKMYITN